MQIELKCDFIWFYMIELKSYMTELKSYMIELKSYMILYDWAKMWFYMILYVMQTELKTFPLYPYLLQG